MANRKLQGEIERVLKKVDEGVHIFEQIWDKVYSATTTAQKEKYEGDLKKEIKKLQRLRDQIKTWQGDSSIKDKSKLDANRKLIEEKMEKFKICEKETKTKAFSKEGLAQDRTDPRQKAKAEVGEFVRDSISRLQEQSDEMEAEIETLNSGKRRKRSEENPRVATLKEHISRHEHHVQMLERVLRAVYNDAVTPEEALDLKDGVNYYIESNQEHDFYEDEEMYDLLNLDSTPVPSSTTSKKIAKTSDYDDDDSSSNGQTEKQSSSTKKVAAVSPKVPKSSRTNNGSTFASKSSAAGSVLSSRTVSPKGQRSEEKSSLPSSNAHSPQPPPSNNNQKESVSPRVRNGPLMSSIVKGTSSNPPKQELTSSRTNNDTSSNTPFGGTLQSAFPKLQAQQGKSSQVISSKADDQALSNRAQGKAVKSQISPAGHPRSNGVVQESGNEGAQNGGRVNNTTKSADAPTVGTRQVSAGPRKVSSEIEDQLAALDSGFGFMSEHAGSNSATVGNGANGNNGNVGSVSPRNPTSTPASFPTVPAPVFENQKIFGKFDPDTLFFIFYYQQGTYQQYLAARELKRQGWRFHKKYLTWFQRHDEPKISTDEYETGTFIYFDYANIVFRGQGTGWCQRIKSEFIFEYRYLEDELV